MDWLHVADLGVTADVLGNIFKMLLGKMAGGTDKDRCGNLFLDIITYYNNTAVDSRLDNLTLSMLGKAGKPPKLRAKGAEARFLVPYALEATQRLLAQDHPVEGAARQLVAHLAACYDCLSSATFNAAVLRENSRKFALLFVALEARSEPPAWKVKPKLHLFQEMCETTDSCPSLCWGYRDEDFGGSLSQLSRRRGGSNNPASTAKSVLVRFMAKHAVPILA
jgi:hypothetical protein